MKAADNNDRQATPQVKDKTKAETNDPPSALALDLRPFCTLLDAADGAGVGASPASPSSAPSPMGAKPASDTLLQELAGQGGALPQGLLHCLSYHDSPRPRGHQQQPPQAAGQGHGLWQQQQGQGGDGYAAGAAVSQCAADEKRRQHNRKRRAAYKARQQQRNRAEAALQAQQQQRPVKQQQQQRHRHRRQKRFQAPERQQQHHQQLQAPASTPIRLLGVDTIRMVLVAAARAATGTKVQDVRGLAEKLQLVRQVQAPGGDGGNGRTVQQVLSTSPTLGASAAAGPVQLAAKRSALASLDRIGGMAGLCRGVQLLLQRHGAAVGGGGPQQPQGKRRQGTTPAAASDDADAFAVWARTLPAALLGELLGDATARAALDGGAPGGAARWLQGMLGFDMEVEVPVGRCAPGC